MLNVCEIFTSIQGESTLSGRLCTFVRLFGCNMRCVWCDTRYSYDESEAPSPMTVSAVIREIGRNETKLVEITGGEPLLQGDTAALCKELLLLGYQVMLETNGSMDISPIPKEVRRIVDVKCPGSGSCGCFFYGNLEHISGNDEIKFVLASISDAIWAKNFCETHKLGVKCAAVIFSPVRSSLPYDQLAEWMAKNQTNDIRLGIQLHKAIWGDRRGV